MGGTLVNVVEEKIAPCQEAALRHGLVFQVKRASTMIRLSFCCRCLRELSHPRQSNVESLCACKYSTGQGASPAAAPSRFYSQGRRCIIWCRNLEDIDPPADQQGSALGVFEPEETFSVGRCILN
jgi:hypothetical protein